MKKIFALVLIAGVSTGLFAQKTSDTEAIKSVIEKETKSFFNIDYQTWASCWAQVPYAYKSFADTTDVNSFKGWAAIDKAFSEYFKTAKPSKDPTFSTQWHDIRIYGNGAYVRFTQTVKDDVPRDPTDEVRILEKQKGGQWKIVHVGSVAKQKE
jgi:ketosteroid isomerase-like protein